MAPVDPAEELALYEALRVGRLRAFRALVADLDAPMARLAAWYAPGEERRLVRATWTTALRGLSMFTWHTTFRAWLVGILVAHARACATPPVAATPGGAPARVLVAPRVRTPVGAPPALADLPWTERWGSGSWDGLVAVIDALPRSDRELLVLEDVEGWPAEEARAILGLTGEEHDRRLASARQVVVRRLAEDLHAVPAPAVPWADAAEVAALLAQLPAEPPPPPGPELIADFKRWRAERGLTAVRRLGAARSARAARTTLVA